MLRNVSLRAAERAVCGMDGWSPWWSSWLSLYTAWCRCPGGREAHLQQCGGQFAWPFAELCGCQRCCFLTRRWCSRSGCSPQCRCRRIWGCWAHSKLPQPSQEERRWCAYFNTASVWADHVRSSVMWTPRNLKLFTRSTGVLSMEMGVCTLLCPWNPPPAPWSCRCWVRGGSPGTI